MKLATKIFFAVVILNAIGSFFGAMTILFSPENHIINLGLDDRVSIHDVRYPIMLLALAPVMFVGVDVLLALGLFRGIKETHFLGVVIVAMSILGFVIHLSFGQIPFSIIDGVFSVALIGLGLWSWKTWDEVDEKGDESEENTED